MKTIRISGLALSILSVAVMAGCASSTPSASDNETAACAALTNYETVVRDAQERVNQATNVGDLRSIRGDVQTAADSANSALDEVAKDRAKDLSDATADLTSAIDGLGDDVQLEEARATLVEEVTAVQKAREQAASDIKCD